MTRTHKYGSPVKEEKIPKGKRRLPEYDECLNEFLKSGSEFWKVDITALPSNNIKVVLSSLKWRTKHNPEFKNIRIFSRKNRIYLERKNDEE